VLFLLTVFTSVTAFAQDDPNAQYLTLLSQSLNDETRNLPVTVEATTLRLFFTVQSNDAVTWDLIAPPGRVFNTKAGNVLVTDTPNKRVIAIWDPRPGEWQVRLKGKGTFTLSSSVQSELYGCCLNLLGRNAVPSERSPIAVGSRPQATVYLSGNNAETVNFQLISERGEVIAPIAFRQNDFSNPYNFFLQWEMPNQPCRIRAVGRSIHGLPYQRVYPNLFQPQPNAPVTENAPVVIAPANDNLMPYTQGEFRIVRAEVKQYRDEPLLSAQGNPVGVRFTYTMVFPREGIYLPQPNLYPERITSGYTGALSLRIARSTVAPLPANADQPNQILFSGRARYESGVPYTFTVDLVPNFAMWREDKKDFWLMTRSYNGPGMKERFERELNSDERLRYRLTIGGTDLDGRQANLTEKGYLPRQCHQSLLKENVGECP
ncbi:MAG: hypothetical protein HOP19_09885, partial [Acidobacteria bacterium]|nr:hypothetical protein [Acidobacteriota bacterium]